MNHRIAIAIATILVIGLLSSRTSDADTVELRTGQRIDGAVQSVSSTDVLVNVAGQSLTISRQKVSAIYLGSRPREAGDQGFSGDPVSEALRILKSLQSATTSGVNYQNFAPRVTDAKIQVDRALIGVAESPVRAALTEAMGFYVYASNAWNARISSSNYAAIGSDPLFEKCLPLKISVTQLIKSANAGRPEDVTVRGIATSQQGIEPLFRCATDRIAEADKLLGGS